MVSPTPAVSGRIRVPGDKSISHRALMLGALADGETRVSGFLAGADCLATAAALRALGVPVQLLTGSDSSADNQVVVSGRGLHGLAAASGALDMGNSGTGMRLLAGMLAAQTFDSQLVGDASLMQRPMERVAEPLRLMGADILTQDGLPPVMIRGGRSLHGIDYSLPVASAQVKSALLLAGLYADSPTLLKSPGITRDHTERMLQAMGVTISSDAMGGVVQLEPPGQLEACEFIVPGDFSSAAFFVVAGLLSEPGAELVIENVGVNPTRIGLLRALELMGGDITVMNERMAGGEPVADLRVLSSPLVGTDLPPEIVPLAIDEIPILCVAAAGASGVTRISGAEELRHKESDRIRVMADALKAVGVAVEEAADGLTIVGGGVLGGSVDSGGDHRIAMSMAVAGLLAKSHIEVRDTANVATSFPGFVRHAAGCGLHIDSLGARDAHG